jgi:desulfoferrodoxin (superoxide reductase-like protein)
MSNRPAPRLHRRDVVKLLPLAFMGSALAGLTRILTACTAETVVPARDKVGNPSTPNSAPITDDDEFVPQGTAPPTNAGAAPLSLPNNVWESRTKQLDAEQLRLFGPIFTAAEPGIFAGKQRSHVPTATVTTENGSKKVVVLVEHAMGKNLLDAGPKPDTGAPVDAGTAMAADAASDAEAGPPPVMIDAAKPPEHYITTIFIRGVVDGKETVIGLWEYNAGDAAPPSVKFTIPAGITSITAWEWCTLHGLWKSDIIPV